MARGKYMSRARRFDAATGDWESEKDNLISTLEDEKANIEESVGKNEVALAVKAVLAAVESYETARESAVSVVNELFDEIDNWKSNMEGTNLENTGKYSELEDCAGELETAQGDLEDASVAFDATVKRTTDELISEIEDMAGDLDGFSMNGSPSFPGMFG